MEKTTLLIAVILFGIIFLIIQNIFSIVSRVKKQTNFALREVEYQIKTRLIEKLIQTGISQSKNIRKYGAVVLKTIKEHLPIDLPVKKVKVKTKTKTKESSSNKKTSNPDKL